MPAHRRATGDRATSALVFPLAPWPAPNLAALDTPAPRRYIQDVGTRWQLMSTQGSWSETASMLGRKWRQHTSQFRANAINELAGLMGSVGEQITLAWIAEQDVQRWLKARHQRNPYHVTMGARALAELSSHFSLGAAHAFANVVLRVLVLNDDARAELVKLQGRNGTGYKPQSTNRWDWRTFSSTAEKPWARLPAIATATRSASCERLVAELHRLRADPRFQALEDRRGMDYHRHRPQSVATSSPRGGVWTFTQQPGGTLSQLSVKAAVLDGQEDERIIRRVAAGGLVAVAGTLGRSQRLIGSAVTSFGYELQVVV